MCVLRVLFLLRWDWMSQNESRYHGSRGGNNARTWLVSGRLMQADEGFPRDQHPPVMQHPAMIQGIRPSYNPTIPNPHSPYPPGAEAYQYELGVCSVCSPTLTGVRIPWRVRSRMTSPALGNALLPQLAESALQADSRHTERLPCVDEVATAVATTPASVVRPRLSNAHPETPS